MPINNPDNVRKLIPIFEARAESYMYSARILLDRYFELESNMCQDNALERFYLAPAGTSLLCSSIELLLKAIISHYLNLPPSQDFIFLEKSCLHHNVSKLKEKVDKILNEVYEEKPFEIDTELLIKITNMIEWETRYPYPKNAKPHTKKLIGPQGEINLDKAYRKINKEEYQNICKLFSYYHPFINMLANQQAQELNQTTP